MTSTITYIQKGQHKMRVAEQYGTIFIETEIDGIKEFLQSSDKPHIFKLTKRVVEAKVSITEAIRRNQQFPVNSFIRLKAPC